MAFGNDYIILARGEVEDTLRPLLENAREASEGDSNDAEIAAWQSLAQAALELLEIKTEGE